MERQQSCFIFRNKVNIMMMMMMTTMIIIMMMMMTMMGVTSSLTFVNVKKFYEFNLFFDSYFGAIFLSLFLVSILEEMPPANSQFRNKYPGSLVQEIWYHTEYVFSVSYYFAQLMTQEINYEKIENICHILYSSLYNSQCLSVTQKTCSRSLR